MGKSPGGRRRGLIIEEGLCKGGRFRLSFSFFFFFFFLSLVFLLVLQRETFNLRKLGNLSLD